MKKGEKLKIMIFKNKICAIEIDRDNTYNINTINKGNYDIVYNLDEYNQDEYYAIISVKVNLYYDNYKIALIGGAVDANNNISILDENVLIVLQNDAITKINVLDGSIILHKHLYSYGDNFEIYKIKNGYIIYGEGEITMLDKEFEIKWTFSGADIFVNDSRLKAFSICEDDTIELYDWQDNFYRINFNGELLNQHKI